jgi:hypothetical protein
MLWKGAASALTKTTSQHARNVLAHDIYVHLFGVTSTQTVPRERDGQEYHALHCSDDASKFSLLAPSLILRPVVSLPLPLPLPFSFTGRTYKEAAGTAGAAAAGVEGVGAALVVPVQAHSVFAPRACRMLVSCAIKWRCVGVGRIGELWMYRVSNRMRRTDEDEEKEYE